MKRTVLALASLIAVFTLALPSAQAENKKAVVSQAFQSLLYLPLYVALDEGMFTKQGLDVSKETAGAPPVALNAVISGSAQFSLHGPEWTAIAASKGGELQIIANVVNGAAVWIAAAPDFDYKDINSFKGQTIVTGTMPTTSTSLFFKLLKENGIDPDKDIKTVQVPIGSEIGAFLAGQGKVAVMYEPGLDQAALKGMKVIFGFPKQYGPYAFSAISTKKDVDPDIAQRFVNGLQAAILLIKTNPAKAIEIAKKEFPQLDPAVVEAATKRMIADKVYPESVDITPEALKTGLNTQIYLGNLKEQPDYKTFVAHSFIEKALSSQ
jgi:NitT/TauT family transport system substrate-binding protein